MLAGLGIATRSWGVLGLVALAAAVIVAEWGGAIDARYVKRVIGIGFAIALAGYPLGSVETFVSWDRFLNGRRRAAMVHGASRYQAPLGLLFGTALYAFRTGGALAGIRAPRAPLCDPVRGPRAGSPWRRSRAVATLGPPWEPLRVPLRLGAEMPGDLLDAATRGRLLDSRFLRAIP